MFFCWFEKGRRWVYYFELHFFCVNPGAFIHSLPPTPPKSPSSGTEMLPECLPPSAQPRSFVASLSPFSQFHSTLGRTAVAAFCCVHLGGGGWGRHIPLLGPPPSCGRRQDTSSSLVLLLPPRRGKNHRCNIGGGRRNLPLFSRWHSLERSPDGFLKSEFITVLVGEFLSSLVCGDFNTAIPLSEQRIERGGRGILVNKSFARSPKTWPNGSSIGRGPERAAHGITLFCLFVYIFRSCRHSLCLCDHFVSMERKVCVRGKIVLESAK